MQKYKQIYTKEQEIQISAEFTRMKDICYLEHAGATLYSEKQMSEIFRDLSSNIYANPHAKSTTSKLTEDSIDQIRFEILNHFNTNSDEYSVIFTNGATGALKIVSESFNYNNGCFAYLQDNHTSVLGMRNNASNIKMLEHNQAFDLLNSDSINIISDNTENSLFVYPAQCNFSGTKYPLHWIDKVQRGSLNTIYKSGRWYCFVDAACYVATNYLDLTKYKPDFVCVSFYKIFGYPTGLGALLVKNTSSDILIKKYYGGGTVFMALSTDNVAIPRAILHERFEDGTISFLDILALKHGFTTLKRLKLDMNLISQHTFSLAKYVFNQLLLLHHWNGQPVAILYHDTTFENRDHQGGVVNFNLQRSNGQFIGYAEVLHIANLFGVQLRTGCFCNPGSCQRHLKLSTNDVIKQYEKGHVCGDQNDLIDGTPTGSVRISFGYMSTKKDADNFLKVIEDCFVETPCLRKIPDNFKIMTGNYNKKFSSSSNYNKEVETDVKIDKKVINSRSTSENSDHDNLATNTITITGTLDNIFIYPIKSCGAFKIENNWRLVPTGLEYDREWMIVNASGVCLTQKSNANLCKIKPYINLENDELELRFENLQKISIPLSSRESLKLKIFPCHSKVCGDPIIGWDCGQEVADWLSTVLNETGLRLLKQSSSAANIRTKNIKGELVKLSLANQAQFLLINKSSIEWLKNYLIDDNPKGTIDDLIDRFRANFVVNFDKPFIENDLRDMKVSQLSFRASGKCNRCQIICINQDTGEKSVDLLRILSKEFQGKISFGMYLKQDDSNEDNVISVKSKVIATANVI
ncbi:molybdopterin cofactor sulfurase mosc [Holotrichia oblita]|uniref:Molybdopterin cofactor sulfurase mosc n=1 Tax=Holotrichia oblita TaxID=644536 RepID=A0ACB9SR17_HOLOL|nr:molybdopterin cofactor sulfurase mosc [Holotrichia oblita]